MKQKFLTLALLASSLLSSAAQPVKNKIIDKGGADRFLSQKTPCQLLNDITERYCHIYLPGCYESDSQCRYPMLYLMHGGGGEHSSNWRQPALEDSIKQVGNNIESLWIDNGDRHIYGIISKPQYTGRKQPVAIIAHGFNGTHASGRTYFKTLNGLGYQCYAFDFPCGSVKSRSDSNTVNMSVLDEQSDLEAIVRHFRQQPDVDAQKIVLIGESQGGFVSAMTAAHIPQDIDKLVLVFPALCIPENWNTRYPKVTDIPDTTRLWRVPLGRRFFMELRDIDVFKTISKFRKPVLIVQGDADAVVSMEDSRRAVELYKDARLYVIPGAGHGFKPEEQQLSLEQIKAFLLRDAQQDAP